MLIKFDKSYKTMQMFRKINETRFSKRKYNAESLDMLPFIFPASKLFESALLINVSVLFSVRRM
jgi:hypothetical protein